MGANGTAETAEDEYMTATEARERLGVSKQKLASLMREGALPTTDTIMDKRIKLVRRSDVERLAQQPRRPQRTRVLQNGGRP